MLNWIGRRLTYANVVSTIALFAALSTGSAYAVSRIGTNGIKNGAVTAKKLHRNAVTTPKIKNAAVSGAKVGADTLTGANLVEASLGQVPSATNADKLGGSLPKTYRSACPGGMTLVGAAHDLCVDGTDRSASATWSNAALMCAEAGLRLPTVSEALEASITNAKNFWTDGIWEDFDGMNNTPYGWYFAISGITKTIRTATLSVRCVATPSDA